MSDFLLDLADLHLVYDLRMYEQRSIRDLVLSTARAPLESLFRARDVRHLLQGITFQVRRGERVGILGINGSGKTSLCRLIAGMLTPASGRMTLQGECRAIFNTMAGIIPELTGAENARLLARLLYPSESSHALDSVVKEALEFTELGDLLRTPFETYSQGMKARLCLAVVTAKTSDLLILDEVYDNTDQFFQRKMTVRLRRFIDEAGATLFVSHSPSHVRAVCNRVIVLDRSKLVFDGGVEAGIAAYQALYD